MHRARTQDLIQWVQSTHRKPLVIRGARQVGKTWLVRHLAEELDKELIEINFEKRPELMSLFQSNDPQVALTNLEAFFNKQIHSETSLLFLDEIQVVPELLAKLRWFAEDIPQLPVIAAGSLLDFVLTDHQFSMPVGRINYMHIEPLSFEEFLEANGKSLLVKFITQFEPFDLLKKISAHSRQNAEGTIPIALHNELLSLFREYTLVGGMPAAVSAWSKNKALNELQQIHHDLLSTYRDDFNKYSGRIKIDRLDEVLWSIPKMLGQKFVFSKVNPSLQAATVRHILDLLEKARVASRVSSCAANGLPLAAEINEKYFKINFLDVGLACTAVGLPLNQLRSVQDFSLVNQGGIAEQVTGQLLRTVFPYYVEPALFYWQREEKGGNAEIDYVIQYGTNIIPLEVKSGTTGSLKSLHLFMGLKKLDTAIRINADLPSITEVRTIDAFGNPVSYQLLSLPFYLLGQVHRLLGVP